MTDTLMKTAENGVHKPRIYKGRGRRDGAWFVAYRNESQKFPSLEDCCYFVMFGYASGLFRSDFVKKRLEISR